MIGARDYPPGGKNNTPKQCPRCGMPYPTLCASPGGKFVDDSHCRLCDAMRLLGRTKAKLEIAEKKLSQLQEREKPLYITGQGSTRKEIRPSDIAKTSRKDWIEGIIFLIIIAAAVALLLWGPL